jgi:hypothetical protein
MFLATGVSYFDENELMRMTYSGSDEPITIDPNVGKIYYLTEQEFANPALDDEYVALSNSSTDQMKTSLVRLNLY